MDGPLYRLMSPEHDNDDADPSVELPTESLTRPSLPGSWAAATMASSRSTAEPTAGPTAGDAEVVRNGPAVLLRDNQDAIPLGRILKDKDQGIVVLLTPVVMPPPGEPPSDGDPFEPLGQALAVYYPRVRHVPYTKRLGITSTHVGFIKRARLVVFVISGPSSSGEPPQADLAEIVRAVGEDGLHQVVVACTYELRDELLASSFPTILQTLGYKAEHLHAVAGLLFGERGPSGPGSSRSPLPPPQPRGWQVVPWNFGRDLQAMHDLWEQSMPQKFRLSYHRFRVAIRREGYSKHYVVRDQPGGQLIGFCATYTTYTDCDGQRLTGSLAAIVVHPSFRCQGVGTRLHDVAIAELRRTRGVSILQLGSTYPRLLYGIPAQLRDAQRFFRGRGWELEEGEASAVAINTAAAAAATSAPLPAGKGAEVADWALDFERLPETLGLSALPGLEFQTCELEDFQRAIDVVKPETQRRLLMGWYDQYTKLGGGPHMEDVVVGVLEGKVVATAITYGTQSGNPVADDVPLAGNLDGVVGGVTCICIPEDIPTNKCSRDAIMFRLLHACIRLLRSKNCTAMMIDGVKGGEEGFQSLGFERWATYKEVWRVV